MKQLIDVLNKIHEQLKVSNKIAISKNKQLEINNKIASAKLFIDFKNSDFKSETKKEIETQAPIIISALNMINKNIYDN